MVPVDGLTVIIALFSPLTSVSCIDCEKSDNPPYWLNEIVFETALVSMYTESAELAGPDPRSISRGSPVMES